MLSYINNFIVPAAPNVVVFPDHENPYKFYCYRSIPKIVKDSGDKSPLFHYTSMSRSANKAKDSFQSLGFLTMTVDIGPTEEEYRIIKEYILKGMKENSALFSGMSKLYPMQKDYKGTKEIVFGTPSWDKGSAQLFLFQEGEGDSILKRYQTGEIQPALFGHCHAAFTETFSEEGDVLMCNFIDQQVNEKSVVTQASVRYNLEGIAYVPSLEVEITIMMNNVAKVFTTMKDNLDKTRRGGIHTEEGPGYKSKTDNRSLRCTREEIKDVIREYKKYGSIKIKIDDLSGFSSEEESKWTDQILESYLDTIINQIIPKLFTEEKVEPISTDTQPNSNVSSDPDEDKSTIPDAKTKVTDKELDRPNVHVNYCLKDNFTEQDMTNITMSLKKSSTKRFSDSPQGMLLLNDLTLDQKKSLLDYIELEDNVHEMMFVPVKVSANFEEDNIYEVQVDICYQHFNPRTNRERKVTKLCTFTTGLETYSFNVTKVRDKNGKFLSTYRYRTRIVFKGQNSDANAGWSNFIETDIEALTISYGMMGYQRVAVSGANFESDYLKEAVVHLEYLGASGKSDSVTDLRLTPDSASQVWKCFRYGSTDNRYKYGVSFRYHDGTEYSLPSVVDNRESLVIWDPYETSTDVDFNIKVGHGIVNAVIEVLFKDGTYEKRTTHTITPGQSFESWQWSTRVRREGKKDIKYRYVVVYEQGQPFNSDWFTVKDSIVFVDIKSDPDAKLEPMMDSTQIQVVTSGIKWDRWLHAFLIVEDDTKKKQTILLSPEIQIIPVDVTYSSEGRGACLFSGKFISKEGEAVDLPETKCSETVFVIKDPKD